MKTKEFSDNNIGHAVSRGVAVAERVKCDPPKAWAKLQDSTGRQSYMLLGAK